MDGYEFARLLYLVLLGAALLGYFATTARRDLGRTARHLVLWGFIFIGTVGAYGLWQDIRTEVRPSGPRMLVLDNAGQVEVPRARDGHFYLTLQVNGAPVDFVVDTGATDVVLTRADAARVGLDPERLRFSGTALTANGRVAIAPVRLDEVRLGHAVDRRVRASVNAGELFQSLLGMSYLQRFERIEIARDRLILTR